MKFKNKQYPFFLKNADEPASEPNDGTEPVVKKPTPKPNV